MRLKILVFILIAIGTLLSLTLLVRHLSIVAATDHHAINVCDSLLQTNCDAALTHAWSQQLGIPLAGWGLVFYAVLAAIVGLGWTQGRAFEAEAIAGAVLLALIGCLASVGLMFVMLSGQTPFCVFCAIVHGINVALLVVLKISSRKSVKEILVAWSTGVFYLFGAKTDDAISTGWKLNGFITATLVGVVVYQLMFILNNRHQSTSAEVVAAYRATPVTEFPTTDDDPRLGPADAPLKLVVFSSFQCQGCQAFAGMMNGLLDEFEGRLSITFKHFPLCTECNPDLPNNLHPQACTLAQAAEAAHHQGKFWQFHDEVFAHGTHGTTLDHLGEHSGLNLVEYREDRTNDRTLDKIESDIQLGNRLKITMTPTIFINGRRLEVVSESTLKTILRNAQIAQP